LFFSLLYIMFFVIDLLIVTYIIFTIPVIGMIPLNYFIAGVGTFIILFLSKKRNSIQVKFKYRFVFWIYYIHIIILSVHNLFIATSHLHLIDSGGLISKILSYIIIMISFFIFLFIPRFETFKYRIIRWIYFSSWFVCIRSILDILPLRLPIKIYMNLGIITLPMLFSWLMIIDSMLKEEFPLELSDLS